MITAWKYGIWLGAIKDDGDWIWNNGDSVNMTRFLIGQPNDTGSCLAMFTNFRWNDRSCNYSPATYRYVCEKHLE